MISLPKLHWLPSTNFSKGRGGKQVSLIVIHDTEGSYGGTLSWFHNPQAKLSAHFVLREDGSEATQMVHLDDKAWHCKAYNSISVGIEMAGFASHGFGDAEWAAAANMTAWLLKEFGIPATSSISRGFCSHYMLGAAGGGHLDPTTSSDVWNHFVKRVQAVDVTQLPPTWPFADPGKTALDHSNMGPD